MRKLIKLVLLAFVSFYSLPHADLASQNDLISSWLVTVEGENRTRTLKIRKVEQKTETSFALDAVYGWTDGNQTAVKAEVRQDNKERELLITTQPGSKIVTHQVSDKIFTGTFTTTNGTTKPITIEKLSEDEFRLRLTPTLETPVSGVPESCRSFIGGWTGKWNSDYSGKTSYGPNWLWVVKVDADCTATYSYGPAFPRSFKTANIKNGELSVPCGSHKGECSFSYHGDELWITYWGVDGTNAGKFNKTK